MMTKNQSEDEITFIFCCSNFDNVVWSKLSHIGIKQQNNIKRYGGKIPKCEFMLCGFYW